ncbi:MAG: manganese ABC transporter permease [Chloroflexi bacterium RBG_13_60_9]|nr:MAG: manganese ABC transporter permease [Chloroflexi bacterium RBG_13_60_9]
MIDFFLAPLQFEFMQRAFLAVGLVCVLCSVVGCFVILRSMAFLGDAIAHSILPGVAVAYLVGGNLTLGALIAAVVVAAGIAFFSRKGALQEDTAIGILFSSALALGIALISTIRSYATDLSHILFGNLLGVKAADLIGISLLGVGILILLFLAYRPLLVITFDPILAATLRLPIALLRTAFLIIIALTIVISLQVIGVALVTAMLVTPAATAYLLTRRFPGMVALSALCGLVSGITGLYASYYLNIASGASVVLSATMIFLLAFFFSPRKGVFRQLIAARRNK